jgi:hypothetical protein
LKALKKEEKSPHFKNSKKWCVYSWVVFFFSLFFPAGLLLTHFSFFFFAVVKKAQKKNQANDLFIRELSSFLLASFYWSLAFSFLKSHLLFPSLLKKGQLHFAKKRNGWQTFRN